MAKAPLPDVLTGKFYVLTYDRDEAHYILHLDDANGSSYRLGSDPKVVWPLFVRWGWPRLLAQDIADFAQQFSAVQCVPVGPSEPEWRTIILHQPYERPALAFPLIEDAPQGWTSL
jgi:hypothetical protein